MTRKTNSAFLQKYSMPMMINEMNMKKFLFIVALLVQQIDVLTWKQVYWKFRERRRSLSQLKGINTLICDMISCLVCVLSRKLVAVATSRRRNRKFSWLIRKHVLPLHRQKEQSAVHYTFWNRYIIFFIRINWFLVINYCCFIDLVLEHTLGSQGMRAQCAFNDCVYCLQ